MSTSMWGYLFLVLGIMAAALLLLFGNINTKNEQTYYLLKEVTQNAMLDSVDRETYDEGLSSEKEVYNSNCPYGTPGTIRIVTEAFLESFTRRYAEIADTNKEYKIEIYDIQECPPKVSLRVTTTENYSWAKRLFRGSGEGDENAKIVNEISAILESIE